MALLTLGTQLAIIMAVSIIAGLLVGLWLDQRLNTAPFATLVFLLVGLAVGSLAAYRTLMSALKVVDKERPKRPKT